MKNINVYNLIILDESGSMEAIKRPTITGFNEVVKTVKAVESEYPEQQHFISLVTFNGDGMRTKLDRVSVTHLHEINHHTFNPRSCTPLFDAIGHSTLKLKYDLPQKEENHVLVTIFTDGEENASREFNGSQIRNLIEDLEQQGWTFTYIGTNHDVHKVADSIGLKNVMHFNDDEASIEAMFVSESKARRLYSQKLSNKISTTSGFYEDDKKS